LGNGKKHNSLGPACRKNSPGKRTGPRVLREPRCRRERSAGKKHGGGRIASRSYTCAGRSNLRCKGGTAGPSSQLTARAQNGHGPGQRPARSTNGHAKTKVIKKQRRPGCSRAGRFLRSAGRAQKDRGHSATRNRDVSDRRISKALSVTGGRDPARAARAPAESSGGRPGDGGLGVEGISGYVQVCQDEKPPRTVPEQQSRSTGVSEKKKGTARKFTDFGSRAGPVEASLPAI